MDKKNKGRVIIGLLSAALVGVSWWRINFLMDHSTTIDSTWYDVTFYGLLLVGILAMASLMLCIDQLLSQEG